MPKLHSRDSHVAAVPLDPEAVLVAAEFVREQGEILHGLAETEFGRFIALRGTSKNTAVAKGLQKAQTRGKFSK